MEKESIIVGNRILEQYTGGAAASTCFTKRWGGTREEYWIGRVKDKLDQLVRRYELEKQKIMDRCRKKYPEGQEGPFAIDPEKQLVFHQDMDELLGQENPIDFGRITVYESRLDRIRKESPDKAPTPAEFGFLAFAIHLEEDGLYKEPEKKKNDA